MVISTGMVSVARSCENVSTSPVGRWRTFTNVVRSAMTDCTFWPAMKLVRSIQCEPMSPTARRLPPFSGSRRQFQSVSRSSQSWK